jgi:RNA polymerase sigma-70 factor (ECF subfamily)
MKQEKSWMNESEIIQKCQQHDLSAYKMIYDRYEQPLLHTALRMLGQQQDAEDAVQMTFLKLYRGIQNYNYSSKFSTYLFRIMMNVCYDSLRKRKRVRIHPLEEWNATYHSRHEEKMVLEEAIMALPERMRACFILFAVEELKQSEIAKILNITPGGVKSTIYHAKTRLRARLSNLQIKESS